MRTGDVVAVHLDVKRAALMAGRRDAATAPVSAPAPAQSRVVFQPTRRCHHSASLPLSELVRFEIDVPVLPVRAPALPLVVSVVATAFAAFVEVRCLDRTGNCERGSGEEASEPPPVGAS